MPPQMYESAEACIIDCTDCHGMCVETVDHCLQMGGEHAAPDHIRVLLDCAEICQTAADFMLAGSDFQVRTCELCAEICERCAEDCTRFTDDPDMELCAETCRRCAQSCREMAGAHRQAA